MTVPLPAAPALTFASINVEWSNHLPRVMAFIGAHSPDVVCLQELMAEDLTKLCRRLGYAHHVFAPMALLPGKSRARAYGVGILSRFPFAGTEIVHYAGNGSGSDLFDGASIDSKVRTSRYVVAMGTIVRGRDSFTIATTHMPWTPNGSVSEHQRRACERLFALLGQRPLILCGDCNAPRGGEIFSRLAGHWRDNIPAQYTSSLDPDLHRAGPLELMVDGIFSTADYRVDDVAMHRGVSDHCAITASARLGSRHRLAPIAALAD